MFSQTKKFQPFEKKIYLSSPTMHGEELEYMKEAYETNWMSTVGNNINKSENMMAEFVGAKYAVALSSGTAALHMAIKLAGERIYGKSELGKGALNGQRVFCSDVTFDATVNPIVYEGGIPVFIDSEYETWNMDPVALEKAFEMFPDVKLIVLVHLYGTPAKFEQIKEIADKHGAIIIEDAAESLGATYKGEQTGKTGKYSEYGCISFNGNKIITGSSGGAFLTNEEYDADKVRKWSTQSRENAPWYQHEELGYNYRMSNVIAGVVRGQIPFIKEHISQKKAIYERYKEGFRDLPVQMNPFDEVNSGPNFWLSCIVINPSSMCRQIREETEVHYVPESGKSCPTEILEAISLLNAEGRPIWKPMHMQPIYKKHDFISKSGRYSEINNEIVLDSDVGADLFNRGLCLPSDNKMTEDEQYRIIDVVKACFD